MIIERVICGMGNLKMSDTCAGRQLSSRYLAVELNTELETKEGEEKREIWVLEGTRRLWGTEAQIQTKDKKTRIHLHKVELRNMVELTDIKTQP